MSVREKIKRILFGYTVSQEYVCVDRKIDSPLKVVLTTALSTDKFDVSDKHLLLGYKPVIIGLTRIDKSLREHLSKTDKVLLSFMHKEHVVATLRMDRYSNSIEGDADVLLFIGAYGEHRFLSWWHRFTNRQRERFKLFSKGNIFLSTNLYEQVRIAYSIPRQIAIVTLGTDGAFNMFPTDLHGMVGQECYASSLRKDGKACEQVMRCKNICISSVPLSWKDSAYQLGKNHMKDLGTLPQKNQDEKRSVSFDFPLPSGLTSYLELRWVSFVDIGIHRVFFYKVVSSIDVRNGESTLHHIHRFYLQWRLNQKLFTAFELRNR